MTPPDSATPVESLSTPVTLRVGDALTVYSVEDLAAAWASSLARPTSLAADLSQVTHCDSLGIQLLLSARRTAEATGANVAWSEPSPAVVAAAKAIGCEHFIKPCQS